MAIENYMPDFAIEAVYDLTVESLKKHGIKAVLVDLDNTLISWDSKKDTKELKISYAIGDNDLQLKIKKAQEILQ